MRQVLIAFCTVLTLAACSDVAPVREVATKPLCIEVRTHGSGYAWFLNDETEPRNHQAIKTALEAYAKVVDSAAELTGRGPDGISENPVVFRTPFDASAEYFAKFAEHCVEQMIYRTRLELSRDGEEPLRISMDLPKDEGLSSGPPKEYLRLRVEKRELTFDYYVGLSEGELSLVPDAALSPTLFVADGWNDALYRSTRKRLVDVLLAKETDAVKAVEAVWIPLSYVAAAPWGAVFLAFDAVENINTSGTRGEKRKWPVLIVEMFPPEQPVEYPSEEPSIGEPPAIKPPALRDD